MGLAHRRLSIIDLTLNGKQHFLSKISKNKVFIFGEIYNFLQLKKKVRRILVVVFTLNPIQKSFLWVISLGY